MTYCSKRIAAINLLMALIAPIAPPMSFFSETGAMMKTAKFVLALAILPIATPTFAQRDDGGIGSPGFPGGTDPSLSCRSGWQQVEQAATILTQLTGRERANALIVYNAGMMGKVTNDLLEALTRSNTSRVKSKSDRQPSSITTS